MCRVLVDALASQSGGTGMLVGPDLLLTCYHVVQGALDDAGRPAPGVKVRVEFEKREPIVLNGNWMVLGSMPSPYDTNGEGGVPTRAELDFALIRLPVNVGKERGWLELDLATREVELPSYSFLTIIQYPGMRQQAAAFDSSLLRFNDEVAKTRLQYRVNTESGSSGSPCFDHEWNLVGMHHAGAFDARSDQGKFNQGIPIAWIAREIDRSGVYDPEPSSKLPPINAKDPSLVVLCCDKDKARAIALLKEAQIPPRFSVRVGNEPPATVADNAIGVYLGSEDAVRDPKVITAVRALRDLNLQVLPVVTGEECFHQETPIELQSYNGAVWGQGDRVPSSLGSRIRQLLGLEVCERLRSVFISYHREDCEDEVAELGRSLRKAGYRTFIDLEDVESGESVQQRIEKQFRKTGCSALLYVESPNAHLSDWIYEELRWAYTRQLAMVVCQSEPVHTRHHLIECLPVRGLVEPLAESAAQIAGWLDEEIARSSTRNVQLARTIEAITTKHEGGRPTIVSLPADPSIMLLRLKMEIEGVTRRARVLVKNSHRRPTTRTVFEMLEAMEAGPFQEQDGKNCDAAILFYDAPEDPLGIDDSRMLKRMMGEEQLLFLVPREDASTSIPRILERLT